MENTEDKEKIILPKGTIVHLQGLPCELQANILVVSSALAEIGLGDEVPSNGPISKEGATHR